MDETDGDPDRRPRGAAAARRRGARSWAARGTGLGSLALGRRSLDPQAALRPRPQPTAGAACSSPLHFAPRAKRVIHLYLAGGPSHLETLRLQAEAGRDARPADAGVVHQGPADRAAPGPEAHAASARSTRSSATASRARRSRRSSRTSAPIADDICIVRSMQTEQINHDPAHTFMNTGTHDLRPAAAWAPGSGTASAADADDLPGFVVLTSHGPRRPDAADRRAAVAQRLPAQPLPGRALPLQGRAGPLPARPRRASRRGQQRDVDRRRRRRSTEAQPDWRGRPRDRRRASASTRWRSGCRRACPR